MFSTHDYNCPFVVSTDEKSYACDCGHISSMDCCTISDPFKKKRVASRCMCLNYLSNCMPYQLQTKYGKPQRNDQIQGYLKKRATPAGRTLIFTSSACYPFFAMCQLVGPFLSSQGCPLCSLPTVVVVAQK